MNKILLLLSVMASLILAKPMTINTSIGMLDNYKYETPKGRIMKVPSKTRLVIVAFEKDTAAVVNDYLITKSKYYIQKHKAVFIADISKMPMVITNMFALPKMKKYKHLLYLHYGKKFQKNIPRREDKITLLEFKDSKLSKIMFATTTGDIKRAIEK